MRNWRHLKILSFMLVVLAAGGTRAQWKDDASEALRTLSKELDNAALGDLVGYLTDTSITANQWAKLFESFFEGNEYTVRLNTAWDHAIGMAGDAQSHVVRLSSLAAAATIAEELPQISRQAPPAGLEPALAWLHRIAPALPPEAAGDALKTLADAGPFNLSTVLTRGRPANTAAAIQVCLTLAELRGGDSRSEGILNVLTLPPAARNAWTTHGLFLFDRDALGQAHLSSLATLLDAIPGELHSISAVITPEALGFAAEEAGLSSRGQIVPIEILPMNTLSDASEFTPNFGQPVAPEFTLRAAQQVVRAIQAKQFAQRPWLRVRRNAILANAGTRKEQYLRRFIPPSTYLNNPDNLLPAVAYLYFIDTSRTWQAALDLFNVGQKYAMDSFLLLADILSGGGGQTLVLRTTVQGNVQARTTSVGRTIVDRIQAPEPSQSSFTVGPTPPELPYMQVNAPFLTGIELKGARWVFELNQHGGVKNWTRDP